MSEFKDKTCIVTGAASGLGKAIAAAFVTQGASVYLCDINETLVNSTALELAEKGPGRAISALGDVSNEASMHRVVEQATSLTGKLDILINNAGLLDRFEPAGQCSKETWDNVLNVNLTGSFVCTHVAIQRMLAGNPPEGESRLLLWILPVVNTAC